MKRDFIFGDTDEGFASEGLLDYCVSDNPENEDDEAWDPLYHLDDEYKDMDIIEIFNDCDEWEPIATLICADFFMAHGRDLSDLKEILLGIIDLELHHSRLGRHQPGYARDTRAKELNEFRTEVEQLEPTGRLKRSIIAEVTSNLWQEYGHPDVEPEKKYNLTILVNGNCSIHSTQLVDAVANCLIQRGFGKVDTDTKNCYRHVMGSVSKQNVIICNDKEKHDNYNLTIYLDGRVSILLKDVGDIIAKSMNDLGFDAVNTLDRDTKGIIKGFIENESVLVIGKN